MHGFSSMLSHEMVTPLNTVIFFLSQVMMLLSLPNLNKEAMSNYCTMMKNQLNFVLSFVEDLLDLK